MRVEHLKRLPGLLVGVLLILAVNSPAYAADIFTKPYFKSYGSDVVTGGWFGDSSCETSNYQDPRYAGSSGTDVRNGGILTYANQNAGNSDISAGGASSQYAAFALGSIDGNVPANSYGFYSAGAQSAATGGNAAKELLSFANTTGNWGGVFELGPAPYDGSRQNMCIPDYYGKMPTNADGSHNIATPLGSYVNTSASYTFTTGAGNIYDLTGGSDVSINPGIHTTVYVDGDVYIGNNITYNLDNVDDVPKFSLVVKGSIYIGPNVSIIEGFYTAQPATNDATTVSADDGDIWTCHPNNTNKLDYTFPAQNCLTKLTINGALAAKQINLMRVKGDVGSAPGNGAEDTLAGGLGSNNIGEVINYTPEVVLGGSYFTNTGSSSTGGLPIDSILSLPPAF